MQTHRNMLFEWMNEWINEWMNGWHFKLVSHCQNGKMNFVYD